MAVAAGEMAEGLGLSSEEVAAGEGRTAGLKQAARTRIFVARNREQGRRMRRGMQGHGRPPGRRQLAEYRRMEEEGYEPFPSRRTRVRQAAQRAPAITARVARSASRGATAGARIPRATGAGSKLGAALLVGTGALLVLATLTGQHFSLSWPGITASPLSAGRKLSYVPLLAGGGGGGAVSQPAPIPHLAAGL